jgi:tRNA A37 threonylcarbamoyladenosine synthetase subunit TsaC/SUA5/YrdC
MDGLDVIAALDAALTAATILREGDPVVIPTELVLATLAVLGAIDD